MRPKFCVFLPCLLVDAASTMPKPLGASWVSCGQIVEKIGHRGNGTTSGSCLACDPVVKNCPAGCQSLLQAMSKSCRGVYTPPDYYFDPSKSLYGFWGDQIASFRVAAARCGCSIASQPYASRVLALVLLLGVICELL